MSELLIDVGGAKNPVTLGGRWKLLDILKHSEYVHDLNSGKSFPLEDKSVDHYYCSHTLEHVNPCLIAPVLKEMRRTLKHGGRLRIVVPDIRIGIDLYINNPKELLINKKIYPHRAECFPPTPLGSLMAWFMTPDKSVQSGHKMGFDYKTLLWCLNSAGFKKVQKMEYNKCSSTFKSKDIKRHAKGSLYVEAEK